MFEETVLLPATRHIGPGADTSLPEGLEREELIEIELGARDSDGKRRSRI